jgi:hypothetical protein
MQLKINHTDEHNDYFTLSDDKGNKYPWHGRKGIKQDPEKCMYKGAIPQPQEGETPLQSMERWIKEGHTNPEISEEYQEEVSPAVFALTPDDPVMKERRVEKIPVDKFADKRKLIPEILKPAVFETRKRILRPEQVIKKVEWVSTHPKTIGLKDRIEKATTIPALKKILLEMI